MVRRKSQQSWVFMVVAVGHCSCSLHKNWESNSRIQQDYLSNEYHCWVVLELPKKIRWQIWVYPKEECLKSHLSLSLSLSLALLYYHIDHHCRVTRTIAQIWVAMNCDALQIQSLLGAFNFLYAVLCIECALVRILPMQSIADHHVSQYVPICQYSIVSKAQYA